jgi:hypothetical protein
MTRYIGDGSRIFARALVVLIVILIALPRDVAAQDETAATPYTVEQIEQLVAPIALYPDSLLAQVLMASTYPLEVVAAQRFAKSNSTLKGEALDAALKDQSWDASVKSLVAFPQVLDMMSEKLDWTQELGDAFLAQQSDVMDGVQRLREKAQAQGTLGNTEQQKIIVEQAPATTTVVEGAPATIIRIEPTNPQVVYVPTYNPAVAYGTWPYPSSPPYYYQPPGYTAAASVLSFGVGMAVGSALWGDCDWGWGHGGVDVDVNRYNNYSNNVTRNYDRNNNKFQNGKWEHDASHRKGVGYRDANTQQRFGNASKSNPASREEFRGRAEKGQRDLARDGGASAQRDLAKGGAPDLANRGGGSKDSRSASKPDLAKGKVGSGGGKPDLAKSAAGSGARKETASRAAASDRAAPKAKQAASRPEPAAFQKSGSAKQVKADANRGAASRQSAAATRSGGGGQKASGGGGGGKKSGGGGGGGGKKPGGGGGGGRRG